VGRSFLLAVLAALVLAGTASANSVYSTKRILASYVRVNTTFQIDQPTFCVADEYGFYPSACFDWEYQWGDLEYRLLRRTPSGAWRRVYSSSTVGFDGRNVERIYGFEVRGGWRCGRYRLRTILVDPYDRPSVSHLLPFRRFCA
jgi:hypothetical protein